MDTWEIIFRQSRVNNGIYDGDRLPPQIWDWPRETWFQNRLRSLRKENWRFSKDDAEQYSNPLH